MPPKPQGKKPLPKPALKAGPKGAADQPLTLSKENLAQLSAVLAPAVAQLVTKSRAGSEKSRPSAKKGKKKKKERSPDDDDSDEDSGEDGAAAGRDPESSSSSSSSSSDSDSSGSSGDKEEKKEEKKDKKERKGAIPTEIGPSLKDMLGMSKAQLAAVTLDDVVMAPQVWTKWIDAPADAEEKRGRQRSLTSEVSTSVLNPPGANPQKMGSFFHERRVVGKLLSIALDVSIPAAARIERLASIIGTRALAILVAHRKGVQKANKYFTKRVYLRGADRHATRALGDEDSGTGGGGKSRRQRGGGANKKRFRKKKKKS